MDLLAERFGEDVYNWAFQCPSCKDVATAQDFVDALKDRPITREDGSKMTASDILGKQCIGRNLGALEEADQSDWKGRGCDWAAYGLFRGPVTVVMPDGKEVCSFPVAKAPEGSLSSKG